MINKKDDKSKEEDEEDKAVDEELNEQKKEMVKDDKKMKKEIKKDEKKQMIEEMRAAKGQEPKSLTQKKESKKEEPKPKETKADSKKEKKDDHIGIEKQFKFYDNDKKPHGILETNMLKKEPEKPLADYQIKEILEYGDKVKDQSQGGHMVQKDEATTN